MPVALSCALRVPRLLKRRHNPRGSDVEVFMDDSLLGLKDLL
jgi:hypothetical protein